MVIQIMLLVANRNKIQNLLHQQLQLFNVLYPVIDKIAFARTSGSLIILTLIWQISKFWNLRTTQFTCNENDEDKKGEHQGVIRKMLKSIGWISKVIPRDN